MATPAQPLAKCILRWLYQQAAAVLKALKDFLLGIIAFIDAQIAWLRALLAQCDILSRAEKFLWDQLQKLYEELKNKLMSFPGGPLADLCPEFYAYFLNPAGFLLDDAMAALSIFRERYHNVISFMDEVDRLIMYWDQTKANLVGAIDIIDAALLEAMMKEAEQVP